jgi:O-antigen/teichoic acid export membrane protein
MQIGAMWMVAFKLADRGLGFISTLILARVLVPDDFGIVAMATVVITLIELFSAFGLDVALIRASSADRDYFDSAWTINVLIGTGVFVILLLVSPIAAAYFHQPELHQALAVLSLGSLIQGLENIGVVAFRRELRFGAEFAYLLGKRLTTMACVIPLALLLRNWWALVAGIVFGKFVGLILSYAIQPYRPHFSLRSAHYFIHFSKWVLMVNAIGFLLQRSADLILGGIAGPHALGLYSVSVELGNLPTTELIAPINRAVYPVYARLAHEIELLRHEYLNVIGAIALLGIPAAVGIVAVARFMVPVLLGQKWLDAVPLVELFGIFGLTQILQTNVYSVYLAIGKPRLQFVIHMVQLILLAAGLLLLTRRHGALGAAAATVIAGGAVLPINLVVVFRQLGVRTLQFLALLWRPVLASGIMLVAIRLLFPAAPPAETKAAIYALLVCVSVGVVTYLGVMFTLWLCCGTPPGAERWLIGYASAAVARINSLRDVSR